MRDMWLGGISFVFWTASLFATCTGETMRAVAVLESASGVRGRLFLTEDTTDGRTIIEGAVEGLSPGRHGFHIHERGDLSQGCTSAGAHYDPNNNHHGGPSDVNRHIGDLGNIDAGPDGVAHVRISDTEVKLSGAHSVLGRAIVVHADQDDLGRGGFSDSLTTGHAGSRVACGVIGIIEPIEWGASSSSITFSTSVALFTLPIMSLMIYLIG